MTVADDIANLKTDMDAHATAVQGGTFAPTTSVADWKAIDDKIAILMANPQVGSLNDFQSLVIAINTIRAKWDNVVRDMGPLSADVAKLQADYALAPVFPVSPTVVPAVTAPGQFSTGQTATVGIVGMLVGLGGGYMLWNGTRRKKNPIYTGPLPGTPSRRRRRRLKRWKQSTVPGTRSYLK